jgi:hypothetical protein
MLELELILTFIGIVFQCAEIYLELLSALQQRDENRQRIRVLLEKLRHHFDRLYWTGKELIDRIGRGNKEIPTDWSFNHELQKCKDTLDEIMDDPNTGENVGTILQTTGRMDYALSQLVRGVRTGNVTLIRRAIGTHIFVMDDAIRTLEKQFEPPHPLYPRLVSPDDWPENQRSAEEMRKRWLNELDAEERKKRELGGGSQRI